MKKIVAILLLLVFVLGTAATASAEKTVVNVWRHSGKEAEQINIVEQIDAFNASHDDIEIAYEVIPEGEYNTQVAAAAMSGRRAAQRGVPVVLDRVARATG